MRMREEGTRLVAWMAIVWLVGGSIAQAQSDPEAGDVDVPASSSGSSFSASGQVESKPSSSGSSGSSSSSYRATDNESPRANRSSSSDSGDNAAPASGSSDHEAAVGHLGVGFFGVATVPIMDCGMAGGPCMTNIQNDLAAPTIGARYWLGDALGIEAALGLRIASGSSGQVDASQFGIALHGGVPLALTYSRHFVFELVPQLNFGVASGSYNVPMGAGTQKSSLSGLLIEAGLKAGAEIHFGFMGLPQLSLQGTVGVMVRHESRKAEITPPAGAVGVADQKQTVFATGVDNSPWDFFRSSIAAIYYFE